VFAQRSLILIRLLELYCLSLAAGRLQEKDKRVLHQYADDMQLYVSLNPADLGDWSTIQSCASDVSRKTRESWSQDGMFTVLVSPWSWNCTYFSVLLFDLKVTVLV